MIQIKHKIYSVYSRLIGEWAEARLYSEYIEIWYGQKFIDTIPRIRDEYKSKIQYRHIIDWLVRRLKAFQNYRYQEGLFPTSRFTVAYDYLEDNNASRVDKDFLEIVYLSAKESDEGVDNALRILLDKGEPITPKRLKALMNSGQSASAETDVHVNLVDLAIYDQLLNQREVGSCKERID